MELGDELSLAKVQLIVSFKSVLTSGLRLLRCYFIFFEEILGWEANWKRSKAPDQHTEFLEEIVKRVEVASLDGCIALEEFEVPKIFLELE